VKNINFLKEFPGPEALSSNASGEGYKFVSNSHIHTPYSFSAFDSIESIFIKAKKEGLDVLGINDFYVTDGYGPFHDGSVNSNIFPLFNIEFIGLMKDAQRDGVRINDPNNPGRIYFCGKGLDFPFHLSKTNLGLLEDAKQETQVQLQAMVGKLNTLIKKTGSSFVLDFEDIKSRYTKGLVRERHLARALRIAAEENFPSEIRRIAFIESLYDGKRSNFNFAEPAGLENEIRSNLLKAGGGAFVEENERSFLPVEKIIGIILDAGGIPCYPVLLDDPSGKLTEFENDWDDLYEALKALGVGCIELIPGRNSIKVLIDFVRFFHKKNFGITFGTEHNTPEMLPLTVTARGNTPPGEELEQICRRGVSVIAGHQYLRAQTGTGFTDENGNPRTEMINEFEKTGGSVIEYFLSSCRK